MTVEPEKLDLASHDMAEEKRLELLRLFPEIRTEGGKIDFERLKLALGELVDVGKERYSMNWPGKAECFNTIQAPSMGTLLPCRKESVDFDATENLIIEGDNLEVLKLLQKPYLGKVKMIYIDPPYNTGNDFIYPDNFSETLQTYLQYTGQVDSEGRKFGTNTDADGRFHSKWINMMYSRLYLAKNLLTQDGVIFVSIDDCELNNLVRILDEIFGEDRRLGCITVVSNMKGRSDDKYYATAHNYLLAYGNDCFTTNGVPLPEEYLDEYPEIAEDGRRYRLQGLRKRGAGARRVDRPNMFFPIYVDTNSKKVSLVRGEQFNVEVLPKLSDGEDGRWRWGRDTVSDRLVELCASRVGPDGRWDVFQIDYAENSDGAKRIKPKSVWIGPEFSNEAGNLELKRLLGKTTFDTAKPVGLLTYCIEQALGKDGIVLDFFAGSGTTAHAVLDLNKNDGGSRKFILVQLPEPTDRTDYPTIAEITKERVRRVIKKLEDDGAGKLDLDGTANQDRGFRVLKLAESNFKPWNGNVPHDSQTLEQQLELHIDHIRPDRTADDLLYEILLKSGFSLTTPVEKLTYSDNSVFSVAGGALLICLERTLTIEVIRAMAEAQPERVICLDEGFAGNDQLKANAVQIFKTKGVISFKTV
ncbi:site-specific DNA-methyltransferase [Oryzomonas sagensis]|uniref:site-specific DNA-methyltransferase (adenine-specific) n=1 Tax=Oryzomonas sagensis TaxID=2603857 RepID=A0ABQ6TND4_9BACT|nr:site-specific DNA-methyltransferase [Oryzomonas sagensis]KAB0670089.1 site-specific DNA-methyltransferase [Oryzomonas sagensis]